MKNIFYILLLLPTIIFAQYPSNSGQKITLGEQTTADGLVYRGVANDTNVITPFSDTSAYIILDTVNSKFYHYNRTTTFWSLAGGGGDSGGVTSFSAGTTGLTPSTATTGAVTLGGTLAVANGGTGVNMSSLPNNYLIRKNASGFFDTSGISSTNGNIGINTSASPVKLTVTDNINLPTTGIGNVNGANVWMVGANSLQNTLVMDAFNNINNIVTRRSNGTSLSPTNIGNGTTIFQFSGRGYGSTGYSLTSRVAFSFAADEDFTDTNHGTRITFSTTNNGTTTQSEKMRITNAGDVGIGTISPTAKLQVNGSSSASEFALKINDVSNNNLLSVQNNGDVTLKNPLSVANGGTNRTTMPAGYILHGDGTSVDTSSQLFWDRTNRRLLFNTTTTTTGEIIMNASANTNANSFVQIFTDNNVAKGYNGYCGQNGHLLNEAVPGDMIFRSQLGRYLFGTYQSGASDAYTALCIANNRNIGIGTTSPTSPFHVNASLTTDQFRITRLEQNNQGLSINAGAGRTYFLNYDGTNNVYPSYVFYSQKGDVILTRMTIETSGAVTINNLAGIADVGADANGKLQAATSDMNLKNTIENSPFGLNEILHLKPVTFLYNDENRKIDSDVKEVGFIAQDVFDIIPNAVSSTGTGDLQLDYRAITATLTKAIQEQQALIKALEQRILNLENK